ncbi:hypothetical protein L3Q82_001915 [Scortum barcoo]|uniref:Uncharacterized protein n=1 Tax=Scortum barcoo TaxID=214431 RepID=A0ACB8W4D2_9TELE|nr:hypothetical protein L3Q82_001915 [Scortum barcoo]
MKQAGKGGYTDQEIYRLKKIVQKLKQEMIHVEDSEAITLMDPPLSFFFGLEKKNEQSRFIHALCSDKGQLLAEAGEIRRRAVQFYAQLYQSEYTEDEGAFNSFCRPVSLLCTLHRLQTALQSLSNLLEEPLIHGARLDVQDSSRPGLSQRLVSARAVKLRHIVDAAGPRLHDAETLASRLGLRSNRHTRNILNAWTTKLTTEELEMLQDYASGAETPDEGDPFPELGLEVDQSELTAPLLVSQRVNMHMVWSETTFIFGAGYKKENAKKCQLNFVVGQAKLSIYESRKKHFEDASGDELLPMFVSLVKARVRVDFRAATMSAGAGLERLTCQHAIKMVPVGGRARHGQLVSPIRLVPLSCKSPHLKHVVSFRRQMWKRGASHLFLPGEGGGGLAGECSVTPAAEGEASLSRPPVDRAAEPVEAAASVPLRAESVPPPADPRSGHSSEPQTERAEETGSRADTDTQVEGDRDVNSDQMEMGGSKEHVAQTATRMAESVLDEEDVVVDDDLLKLATKSKI